MTINGFYLNQFICSIAEDDSKENDTHNNLQLLREAHNQNIKPHGSQTVLQNPGLSLAKNVEKICTIVCQSNPKCPTLKMT